MKDDVCGHCRVEGDMYDGGVPLQPECVQTLLLQFTTPLCVSLLNDAELKHLTRQKKQSLDIGTDCHTQTKISVPPRHGLCIQFPSYTSIAFTHVPSKSSSEFTSIALSGSTIQFTTRCIETPFCQIRHIFRYKPFCHNPLCPFIKPILSLEYFDPTFSQQIC